MVKISNKCAVERDPILTEILNFIILITVINVADAPVAFKR